MTRHPALLVLALWAAGLGAAAQFGKISVIFDLLVADYGTPGRVAFMVSIVGLVGLVFGTTAALDGWQAAARGHDEDGGAISPAASDHRRQQRHPQTACPCRGPAGHMACRDADTQTTDAGAGGAGEQDGTDRLGPDGPGRRLPVSGRGGMSPL